MKINVEPKLKFEVGEEVVICGASTSWSGDEHRPNDETSPRDFTKPNWRTFHFGSEDYELATADENGVLVFRDAIFEAPLDDKDDWRKCRLS